MPKYLASQIYKEKLDYDDVITKFPDMKEAIDIELAKM